MDKISFFSADYRDGRVHIGGKSYPAGTFAAHLLNQYYEMTPPPVLAFSQRIIGSLKRCCGLGI